MAEDNTKRFALITLGESAELNIEAEYPPADNEYGVAVRAGGPVRRSDEVSNRRRLGRQGSAENPNVMRNAPLRLFQNSGPQLFQSPGQQLFNTGEQQPVVANNMVLNRCVSNPNGPQLVDVTNRTPRKANSSLDMKRKASQRRDEKCYEGKKALIPLMEPMLSLTNGREVPLETRLRVQDLPESVLAMGNEGFPNLHSPDAASHGSGVHYKLKGVSNPQTAKSAYRSISKLTLRKLLEQLGDDFQNKFLLFDCRYPYEYEGGHIRFAKNVYKFEDLVPYFYEQQGSAAVAFQKRVPIFYCEFSQQRGPTMAARLRKLDRDFNNYPNLDYPEMYLLDMGYKNFFKKSDYHHLVEPQGYIPMFDANYGPELAKHISLLNADRNRASTCRRGQN